MSVQSVLSQAAALEAKYRGRATPMMAKTVLFPSKKSQTSTDTVLAYFRSHYDPAEARNPPHRPEAGPTAVLALPRRARASPERSRAPPRARAQAEARRLKKIKDAEKASGFASLHAPPSLSMPPPVLQPRQTLPAPRPP